MFHGVLIVWYVDCLYLYLEYFFIIIGKRSWDLETGGALYYFYLYFYISDLYIQHGFSKQQ